MIHLRSATNATVTPWQLRRPRTFRARGFGSQRHGSADKRHQLKQWMRVESCSFAASFEESWPNPTDAPEEAGNINSTTCWWFLWWVITANYPPAMTPAIRPGCFKMALNLALASSWSRLLVLELLHAEPHQPFAAGQWAKVVLFEGATTCARAASLSAKVHKMSEECGQEVKCYICYYYLLCFWELFGRHGRHGHIYINVWAWESHAYSHDRIIHHGPNMSYNKFFRFGTDNARASSAGLAQADHLKTAVVAASPQSWAVV